MIQNTYFSHIQIHWTEVNLHKQHRAAEFHAETTTL